MMRKIAVVAMSVFGAVLGPLRQAQVILLVLLMCLIGEVAGRPYKTNGRGKILGHLELGALVVEWGTMWAGIMIFASVDDEDLTIALTILVALVNVGVIAWMLFCLVREKFMEDRMRDRIRNFLNSRKSKTSKPISNPNSRPKKRMGSQYIYNFLNMKKSKISKPARKDGKSPKSMALNKASIELTRKASIRKKGSMRKMGSMRKRGSMHKVRSMKRVGSKRKSFHRVLCPECNQPYLGIKVKRGPPPRRPDPNARHRRKSTHVADIKTRRKMYSQSSLSRSRSVETLVNKNSKKGGDPSSKLDWLDFVATKRSLSNAKNTGMKDPKASFSNFRYMLNKFATTSEPKSYESSTSDTFKTEFDVRTGCYYRYNIETGESEWLSDSEDGSSDGDSEDEWPYSPADPDVETRFDDDSGYYYQINLVNGDSRWLEAMEEEESTSLEDGELNLANAATNPLYKSKEDESASSTTENKDIILTKSGKRIHRKTTTLSKAEGDKFLDDLAKLYS